MWSLVIDAPEQRVRLDLHVERVAFLSILPIVSVEALASRGPVTLLRIVRADGERDLRGLGAGFGP
jgi:hypothetical protein